jgi:hypothetical protein
MHAVSMTPHAKCDTACIMDQRFMSPWQPLKGIPIKNIFTRMSYPTTKKFSCTGVPVNEGPTYFHEFEAEFKKALALNQRPRGDCLILKKRRTKISHDTAPLRAFSHEPVPTDTVPKIMFYRKCSTIPMIPREFRVQCTVTYL